MAKNEVVKVVDAYPILAGDDEMMDIIKTNMGDGGEMNAFDLDRIKIPGSGGQVWDIPGLTESTASKTIEGIIVYYQDIRGYWPGEFSGSEPPECSSMDAKTGVGQPGGVCKECAFSKFGTAAKGEGQACKAMRRLFLMLPGAALPILIAIPPTSLKSCKQYLMRLTSARVPYYGAVTRIGLEKATSPGGVDYSKCVFDVAKLMTPEEIKTSKAYSDQIKALVASKPIALDDYSEVAV